MLDNSELRRPTIQTLTHANIESILNLEDKERAAKPMLYRLVTRAAAFCGTIAFMWINLAIFLAWIAFNEIVWAFDPYPFTFLLFVVSLEAIFLAILILISQNMSAKESERRHHLDLQINLLNEREMTAMLRLTAVMAIRMGIDDDDLNEVRALTENTDPATVLKQIVAAESAHERTR